MPFRNGPHGYGLVSKALHWLTVAALIAQFTVGYLMDADDGGRGRGRGRGGDSGRGRGRGGDSGYLDEPGTALIVHVALGLLILALVVARVCWRRFAGLPPWAPTLSGAERKLATWTERALLTSMLAMPATGIALIASGDDDLLGLHIAAHVTFFVAITLHLGLVLKHTLVDRDGLLRRMTWGGRRVESVRQI